MSLNGMAALGILTQSEQLLSRFIFVQNAAGIGIISKFSGRANERMLGNFLEKQGQMIKVQQTVPVYELDGKKTPPDERLQIGVDSHSGFIVLIIGEHRYTVVGKDLLAAVENARNTNRH